MLTVISPAKKLDEKPKPLPAGAEMTEPRFGAEAARLARIAKGLSVDDLRALMDISEPLARLNHDRFRAFAAKPAPARTFPAMLCFAGDTYTGLDAATMSPDARHWATGHLRILSGLYGLLRPFDAIQPYRLEMGSKLAHPKGPDLYSFWGDKIARALVEEATALSTDVLVNCASVEYFTAAARKTLRLRVISPVFLDGDKDSAKVISFWAKKARGSMARFICDHHLTSPDDLRGFTLGGYAYQPGLSKPDAPVFWRKAEAEAAA